MHMTWTPCKLLLLATCCVGAQDCSQMTFNPNTVVDPVAKYGGRRCRGWPLLAKHFGVEVRATAVAYPKTSDETEFRVTTGLNFEQLLDDACTYFGVARKGGQHSGHKGDGWRMALIDPVTGETWLGSWTVAEEMARLEEESEAGSTTAAAKGGRSRLDQIDSILLIRQISCHRNHDRRLATVRCNQTDDTICQRHLDFICH